MDIARPLPMAKDEEGTDRNDDNNSMKPMPGIGDAASRESQVSKIRVSINNAHNLDCDSRSGVGKLISPVMDEPGPRWGRLSQP